MTKKQVAKLILDYDKAFRECYVHRSYSLRGELCAWALEELAKAESRDAVTSAPASPVAVDSASSTPPLTPFAHYAGSTSRS